jgi:flagellar hook protein FlgE
LSANLDSALYPAGSASTAILTNTYSAASTTTSMAAYDQGITTGTKPDYSTQLTVYDSQGGSHTVQMDFLKTTTANVWDVEMTAIPASDVDATAAPNGQLASGTITFNSDGTFNSTSLVPSAATATPTVPAVSTPAAGAYSLAIPWNSALGVSAQTVTLNLNSAAGGLTQYASTNTTNSDTVDGGPSATVTGIKVTDDGYVQASFSNGTTRNIAQVAIATFVNENGLSAVSGNAYTTSGASGGYTLKSPGEGSAGTIEASQLESSTVDLSSEFTNLIVTQRAYSAASKIITTADQMLQELIAVKQ